MSGDEGDGGDEGDEGEGNERESMLFSNPQPSDTKRRRREDDECDEGNECEIVLFSNPDKQIQSGDAASILT